MCLWWQLANQAAACCSPEVGRLPQAHAGVCASRQPGQAARRRQHGCDRPIVRSRAVIHCSLPAAAPACTATSTGLLHAGTAARWLTVGAQHLRLSGMPRPRPLASLACAAHHLEGVRAQAAGARLGGGGLRSRANAAAGMSKGSRCATRVQHRGSLHLDDPAPATVDLCWSRVCTQPALRMSHTLTCAPEPWTATGHRSPLCPGYCSPVRRPAMSNPTAASPQLPASFYTRRQSQKAIHEVGQLQDIGRACVGSPGHPRRLTAAASRGPGTRRRPRWRPGAPSACAQRLR